MLADRRLRVAVLIDTRRLSGPARGLLQLQAALPEVEFTFCTPVYGAEISTEFIAAVQATGARIVPLKAAFHLDPRLPARFRAALRSEPTDLIQTHGYKEHVIARIARRRLEIPWVAVTHGWTQEDLKVRIYHRIGALFAQAADSAVTISPDLFERIRASRGAGRDTRMILNAVNLAPENTSATRLAARRTLGIEEAAVCVAVIGRLSREKGQSIFLQALSEMQPNSSQFQTLIVGEGPEEASLRQLAQNSKLGSFVRFSGYVADLDPIYRAADLVVIPSLSEGLPNVMLEAMSRGVPVLATAVGSMPQVVKDGETGWLVEPGSPSALAGGISAALQAVERRELIGRQGRSSLHPRFGPRRRAEEFLDLYQHLLRSRHV